MPYTYGNFWNEVYNSLERDQRFFGLVDVAANRAIDEVFARSNFGNFQYDTVGENGRETYNLPEGTLYVNNVVYDSVPMDRITFKEHLQRKAFSSNGIIYYTRPVSYVVTDNRDLIMSPMPREAGKTLTAYITIKTADLVIATNENSNFPLARVYTTAAFHFARHYLYLNDNRDKDAERELLLFDKAMAEDSRRLSGSVKTKVTRLV